MEQSNSQRYSKTDWQPRHLLQVASIFGRSSRHLPEGRKAHARSFEGQDPEMAQGPSIHNPLVENGHMAIPLCKEFWEL